MAVLDGSIAGFTFLDDIDMISKSTMLCDYLGVVGERYHYDLEHYVKRHVCSWGLSQAFVPICISAIRNDEFWSSFRIKTMQIVLGSFSGVSRSVALSVLQVLPALCDLIRQKRVSLKDTWDLAKDEILVNSIVLALNKAGTTILRKPMKSIASVLGRCSVSRLAMSKAEQSSLIKHLKSLGAGTTKKAVKTAVNAGYKAAKAVTGLGINLVAGFVIDAVANYLCEQWDKTMSKTLYTNLSSEISLNVVSTSNTGIEFIPVLQFIKSSAFLADFVLRNHLLDGEFECMLVSLVDNQIDPENSEFQVGKTGGCMLDDPFRIDYNKSYVIIIPVGPVVLYKTIRCSDAEDFFFKYDLASSPFLQDRILTKDTKLGLAKYLNPYNLIRLAATAVYMLC